MCEYADVQMIDVQMRKEADVQITRKCADA